MSQSQGELPEGDQTPSLHTPEIDLLTEIGKIRYDALASDYNDLPTYPVRPSYKEFHSRLTLQTQCVVFDGSPKDPHKPSSVPIYQTAVSISLLA